MIDAVTQLQGMSRSEFEAVKCFRLVINLAPRLKVLGIAAMGTQVYQVEVDH